MQVSKSMTEEQCEIRNIDTKRENIRGRMKERQTFSERRQSLL